LIASSTPNRLRHNAPTERKVVDDNNTALGNCLATATHRRIAAAAAAAAAAAVTTPFNAT